jgi:hypothetical protein
VWILFLIDWLTSRFLHAIHPHLVVTPAPVNVLLVVFGCWLLLYLILQWYAAMQVVYYRIIELKLEFSLFSQLPWPSHYY